MVLVKLKSGLTFQCNPEFAEALQRELTIENPAYRRAEARMASTARILPEFTALEYRHGDCWLPRGALQDLRAALEKRGAGLVVVDGGMTCPEMRLLAKCRVLSHQAELIARFYAKLQGVALAHPTAHIATGVATIATLSVMTLVITDGVPAREAWSKRLGQVFPGQVGYADGRLTMNSPIVCASMKDLVRWRDYASLRAFLARFGLLIVDDCENAVRSDWRDVIDLSPAKYRLGIANVPAVDTDELTMLNVARWRFGEILGNMPSLNLYESTDLPARATGSRGG